MDKELLRVVIIATGLLVIIGMLAWHFFKNRGFSGSISLFGNLPIGGKIDESLVVHNEHDDFDITPKKTKRYTEPKEAVETVDNSAGMFENFDVDFDFADALNEQHAPDEHELEHEPEPRFIAPDIIKFCIMAKDDEGFNGHDLNRAFQIVGLEYGNLKIFERLDGNRLVDFGVASMVEPGTFPEQMDDFFTPGIVFFMQPALLDDAVSVFDDLVDTISLLVIELNGEALDYKRQPLTDEAIDLIRHSL
jgi:cell division protein ZipA